MWAAWNAGFDRAVWNFATLGFPELKPRHIIDVMAQAVASGLPPDLKMASGKAGDQRKDRRGAVLIRLFCLLIAPPPRSATRSSGRNFVNTPCRTSRRCARCSSPPASCRSLNGASTGRWKQSTTAAPRSIWAGARRGQAGRAGQSALHRRAARHHRRSGDDRRHGPPPHRVAARTPAERGPRHPDQARGGGRRGRRAGETGQACADAAAGRAPDRLCQRS